MLTDDGFPPVRPDLTPHELLLEIARCPIMQAHLEGRGGGQRCKDVVLHQWPNGLDLEVRQRRWRREHHTPVPWVGHLETAPILFVSSNPNLAKSDLRKPEEVPIPESETLPHLRDATPDLHPSLQKPFRAPKRYWDANEVVDYYESTFDVWVKDDGATLLAPTSPVSGTSPRRRAVPYWAFCREQALQLFPDQLVKAGVSYALTEAVHCKSAEEHGVDKALPRCSKRYLPAILARSPARVVMVVGVEAARAFKLAFDVERDGEAAVVGPIDLAGATRLLLYVPHPSWLDRQPKEVAEALVLPTVVSPEQLKQLRAAACSSVSGRPGSAPRR